MPNELIPACPDRWEVITRHKPQSPAEKNRTEPLEISHHELCFGGRVQLKKIGSHGLEILREMAKFMNARGLKPRRPVECAADAPNPQKYLKNLVNAL